MKARNLSRFAKNLFVIVALTSAGSAYSAGYLKIDGVKGEARSTAQEPAKPTTPKRLKSDNERPAALLLPAVQKAADAPSNSNSDSKKREAKIEYQWKIEHAE